MLMKELRRVGTGYGGLCKSGGGFQNGFKIS